MEFSLSIIALFIALALLVYKFIIFPVFFSPFARIPTPNPLCAITNKYSSYLEWREKEPDWLVAAHRTHGPIIRIGASTVNVNSIEGLRKTYISLEKHPYYASFRKFFYNGIPNMFTTLDHQTHSVQKRMLSGIYSKSYLQRSEDMRIITQHIFDEKLMPLFEYLADRKKPVNVFLVFESLAVDFLTAYAFGLGNSTQLIQNQGHQGRPYDDNNDPSAIYESKDPRDMNWFPEDECLDMCKKTAANIDSKKSPTLTKPIVFSKIYTELSKQTPSTTISRHDILLSCAAEVRDHTVAAQEGIATTLTYAFLHLSKNPDLQNRLRTELATAEDTNNFETLPLLNAILYETLRLNAPSMGRQPRLSPSPQGLTLHNFYIPPNTTLSSSSYALHRNKTVFPDPETFNPDRWLPHTSSSSSSKQYDLEEMRRWWWAFGSGGRMCIGNHFAEGVMLGVLARVFGSWGLRTWVVDERGSEQMKTFLATPRGRRLVLGVGRVGEE